MTNSSEVKMVKEVKKEKSMEPGCAACGNPAYPECKTSCPLFDDKVDIQIFSCAMLARTAK